MSDHRVPLLVGFDQDLFDAIEEYRATKRPIPHRTHVIRELVRRGLALPAQTTTEQPVEAAG